MTRTLPLPLRNRILAYVVFAGIVAAIVLALELTLVRKAYEEAEARRRAAVRQLVDVSGAIERSGISSEEKADILKDVVRDLGTISGRRAVR